MGRLHLAPGTRYLQGGQVYIVRQLLLDGRLLVENQTVGGQSVLARDEFIAAWGRGAITFEVHGHQARSSGDATLPTAYTIADFGGLPEAQRGEAWQRYALIRPLLTLPARERTRRAIEQVASDAATRQGARAGVGATRASVERYLRAFERSGGDIRSLVPATAGRGAGRSYLDAEVELLIQDVLAACRAAPAYRTVRDVYLMVVNRVSDANRARLPEEALSLPGRTTIYRRVEAAGADGVLRRRPSSAEARVTAGVQRGPRPMRPLERVEVDHTALDLIVVDEEDRLPIGRPTVTLALDVYSGFPTGVHVGFEAAGYGAAMRCLLHAILPKEDARTRYGTAHLWPVHGLPEMLVVDHAPHFVGADLRDACGQLGISLDPTPVRRPWFKGAIERQFRTHNTGLIHTLPGTTFSNVVQRGDYDAAGHACISLTRFWEILHVYLLDVYAQDWHTGVRAVPAQRWAEAEAGGWAPALHPDATEVRILLARGAVRTIQRTGIDHLCLRYQSAELDEVRRALPGGTPVAIRYDPDDLGTLYVRDPQGGGGWVCAPALDQDYARGLSLWKHRVIRDYARRTMARAVDVAGLAAAKAHIQGIVDDEFRRTRTRRGRTRGARFKDAGATGAPFVSTVPPPPAVLSVPSPDDPASREQLVPDPTTDVGWGADYGLPRDIRRDRWR